MRKIIAAATTLAVLAVPAVSMAANTQTTVAKQAFTASYVDVYGTGAQTDCVGTHVVKTAKNAANSYVIDREQCKLTFATTTDKGKQGKPDAVLAPFAPITEATFGDGWASDFNHVMSTSVTGHANSKGTGYSMIATYPIS